MDSGNLVADSIGLEVLWLGTLGQALVGTDLEVAQQILDEVEAEGFVDSQEGVVPVALPTEQVEAPPGADNPGSLAADKSKAVDLPFVYRLNNVIVVRRAQLGYCF